MKQAYRHETLAEMALRWGRLREKDLAHRLREIGANAWDGVTMVWELNRLESRRAYLVSGNAPVRTLVRYAEEIDWLETVHAAIARMVAEGVLA